MVKSFRRGDKDFWLTETGVGLRWEKIGAKLLGAKHLLFNNGPDLDWNGKAVDVKVARIWRNRSTRGGKPVINKQQGVWNFHRNRLKPVDFFLCFCLSEKGEIEKTLLIPGENFARSGICIGKNSIYDQFVLK